MRTCIICRKAKREYEFNIEHIIPETIGGALITRKVCKKCNSKLGKYVDQPFDDHPYISSYRKMFNLKKDNRRKIKNSLSKYILKDGNDKYRLEFNEDCTVTKTLITEFPEINNESFKEGYSIKIDKTKENEIETIKKKIAKKLGVNASDIYYKIDKVEKTESSKVQILTENNPMIFGFIKMLYETAAITIDDYIFDNDGKKFSEILLTKNIDNDMKSLINPGAGFYHYFNETITARLALYEEDHFMFISGAAGVGLIGIAKIFNTAFPMILSRNMKYEKEKYILIRNNFIDKKYQSYTINKISNATIEIDRVKIKDYLDKNESIEVYKNEENNPNIFDQYGRIKCENIFDLLGLDIQKNIDGDFMNDLVFTIDKKEDLFIKARKDDKLLKLDKVVLYSEIVKHPKLFC